MQQVQVPPVAADQVGNQAGRGADFLQLDPAAAPPHGLADWLTAAVRGAISDGRLAAGSRLPATRVLAGQLRVSRGVVVEAYQRLTTPGRHRP